MKNYLFLFAAIALLIACNDDEPTIQPKITGFEPASAGRCEWVRITGSLFDSIAANNEVRFNGVLAEVEFASDSVLLVRVPEDAQNGPIEVVTGGHTLKSAGQFTLLKGHWNQLPDFPGTSRFQATGFVLNGKLYMGLGSMGAVFYDDFWEFDPVSGFWTKKADYPGGPVYNAVGFELNGKGYVGFGSDGEGKLFEYDADSNSWTEKTGNTNCATSGPFVFTLNGEAYFGGGSPFDDCFFKYDPVADTWATIPQIPLNELRVYSAGFTLNDKGYMGLGGYSNFFDFHSYDPATATWSEVAGLPANAGNTYEGCVFTIGEKAYARVLHQFWTFDPSVNVWKQIAAPCGNPAYSEVGLATGGKGYLICGLAQPRFAEVANLPGYINWDSKQV